MQPALSKISAVEKTRRKFEQIVGKEIRFRIVHAWNKLLGRLDTDYTLPNLLYIALEFILHCKVIESSRKLVT